MKINNFCLSVFLVSSHLFVFLNSSFAHNANPLQSIKDFKTSKLSANIYIVHGPKTFPNKKYQGFNNNPAFVVTKKGIIVIDPGSSVFIGRELLNKIAVISKLPVIAVFNTHVHGDHWLGNHAIQEKYPKVKIYAHYKMIEQIKNGAGKQWIEIMNKITDNTTKGTKVVSPNQGLKGNEELKISNINIKIYHTGKAHTDTDLMIEISNDKTLFLGDIITRELMPSARPQDGSLPGQIKAIEFALKTKNKIFVPGHGKSGTEKYVKNHLRFLKQLNKLINTYFKQGLQAHQMKPKIIKALNKYKHWGRFKDIGRIINHEFVVLENESI